MKWCHLVDIIVLFLDHIAVFCCLYNETDFILLLIKQTYFRDNITYLFYIISPVFNFCSLFY